MKKRKRLITIAGAGLIFPVLLSAFMAGRDLHERKQDADAFEAFVFSGFAGCCFLWRHFLFRCGIRFLNRDPFC